MTTTPFNPATDLRPGDRVKVNGSVTGPDRLVVGRTGIFRRYTQPHRYAEVLFDHDERGYWLLHPEHLDREVR